MKIHANAIVITMLWASAGIFLPNVNSVQAQPDDSQKAVLVTGASTGIGRTITEFLAARGYFVYAGARSAEDLAELDSIENVQSIKLDVTIPEEIAAAVEEVTKAGRGLYGLVNNAGVAILAPLIEVEEADLDFQLDVNLYGPYRITKAFSHLLIEQQGRITTIGSISGILSGAFLGPYSMSKHAVEAYTDALAAEIEPLGVRVSVVEPGNYRSQIGVSLARRRADNNQSVEGSLFEERLKDRLSGVGYHPSMKSPDEVAEAVLHALFAENPKRRYMVVPDQHEAEITIRKAMQEMVELNHGHQYSYEREALITMLDEALDEVEQFTGFSNQ